MNKYCSRFLVQEVSLLLQLDFFSFFPEDIILTNILKAPGTPAGICLNHGGRHRLRRRQGLAALGDHPIYLKAFDSPYEADYDQQSDDAKNDPFFHVLLFPFRSIYCFPYQN